MASAPFSGSNKVQPENQPVSIKTEIQRLLQAGAIFFNGSEEARALAMFKKAYLLSRSILEPRMQARCLFNLGAAYIMTGKPKKALKCLWKIKEAGAQEKDGDLYFNIAAAYENMGEYTKAVEFYRKAINEYDVSQTQSAADALVKVAYCLVSTGDLVSAAQSFRLAGHVYQNVQQLEDAAMAMREAANYFLRSQTSAREDVLETLQACSQLFTGITNQALLGKLYNHVGLHYAELKCFGEAEKYFVEAMKLYHGGEKCSDRKRAVLLQNLGAIYNALEQYEKSLQYHGEAANLYGALRERTAQAQCLYNLASAYSQLKNYHTAKCYYQQTLKAFMDVGDSYGEAQACEGLGTTHLGQGNLDLANHYYKQALDLFEKSKETSEISRERIREKLAYIVNYQANVLH